METNETVKPKKLKRHFFLLVPLITVALLILGEMLGGLLTGLVGGLVPQMADEVVFLHTNYLVFLGIDLLALGYCALWEKPLFRSFLAAGRGGGAGNTPRALGLGLGVGFGMNALCVLAALLHRDVAFSFGVLKPLYLIYALLCVAIQSTAEELLTRGYMMGALRERYGVWFAAIANSLLFGVLHLLNPGINPLAVANIVLFGLFLSLLMARYNSIWACAAIHTAWNYTQNILFGLPNSGLVSKGSLLHLDAASSSLLYDAAFGVEAAVPAIVLLLAGCVLLLIRRDGEKGAGR